MISIILTLFEERLISASDSPQVLSEENLDNCRVKITGYLSETKDVIVRSIDKRSTSNPRGPPTHKRITSL